MCQWFQHFIECEKNGGSYIDHEAEHGQTVRLVRCLAKACVFIGIPVNQVKLREENNLHVHAYVYTRHMGVMNVRSRLWLNSVMLSSETRGQFLLRLFAEGLLIKIFSCIHIWFSIFQWKYLVFGCWKKSYFENMMSLINVYVSVTAIGGFTFMKLWTSEWDRTWIIQ